MGALYDTSCSPPTVIFYERPLLQPFVDAMNRRSGRGRAGLILGDGIPLMLPASPPMVLSTRTLTIAQPGRTATEKALA